jgi:hypothetical protein
MSTPILTFAMPEYGRVVEKRQSSYLTSFMQWLQLKKYQYEVTFSLYMLTSTEKFIFSTLDIARHASLHLTDVALLDFILFLLVSLLVTAATLYLPSHIVVIYNRMSYYVHGERAYNAATGPSGETISFMKEGLRATSEAIKSATTPTSLTGASARAMLKEL